MEKAETGSNLILQTQKARAQYFTEDLGNGIGLDMVLVPAGRFLMGSSEDEPERSEQEGPQHWVSVPSFFMGRYPVTQQQWRAVASLEPIERELRLDPSHFKGDDRPVEQVSWYDSQEFCDRLSQMTGRDYRLPSESEWEYACRAETTTPFFFGETITPELANYRATTPFGIGPVGNYREETTPIGSFFANAFGLSDMHGNVWEWCQDVWHETYEGAPHDGSDWTIGGHDGSAWAIGGEEVFRILRGGAWYCEPKHCRSAKRNQYDPRYGTANIGFRVVCVAPPSEQETQSQM